jgi:hypothetical protein
MTLKVGPGLLSDDGTWRPCRFTEHESTGLRLYRELYPEEAAARLAENGFVDGLYQLCEKHGWVRVGQNGQVSDAHWNQKDASELTQEQVNILFDLFSLARAKIKEGDASSQLHEYADGLALCLDIDPYTLED